MDGRSEYQASNQSHEVGRHIKLQRRQAGGRKCRLASWHRRQCSGGGAAMMGGARTFDACLAAAAAPLGDAVPALLDLSTLVSKTVPSNVRNPVGSRTRLSYVPPICVR